MSPSRVGSSPTCSRIARTCGSSAGKPAGRSVRTARLRLRSTFIGRLYSPEPQASQQERLLALLLEGLDLLILPVVVAGGHRHQQAFHAPVLFAAQDAQSVVELLEILACTQPIVERADKEILQASDREP